MVVKSRIRNPITVPSVIAHDESQEELYRPWRETGADEAFIGTKEVLSRGFHHTQAFIATLPGSAESEEHCCSKVGYDAIDNIFQTPRLTHTSSGSASFELSVNQPEEV